MKFHFWFSFSILSDFFKSNSFFFIVIPVEQDLGTILCVCFLFFSSNVKKDFGCSYERSITIYIFVNIIHTLHMQIIIYSLWYLNIFIHFHNNKYVKHIKCNKNISIICWRISFKSNILSSLLNSSILNNTFLLCF